MGCWKGCCTATPQPLAPSAGDSVGRFLVLFTIAMAGPRNDVRIPRNRAVVMLVIDVSQSMRATDVEPSRLAAAQVAAKQFADQLTPVSTWA